MHPSGDVTFGNLSDKADQFANGDRVMAVGLLLTAAAAVLAMVMVRTLSARQELALSRRSSQPPQPWQQQPQPWQQPAPAPVVAAGAATAGVAAATAATPAAAAGRRHRSRNPRSSGRRHRNPRRRSSGRPLHRRQAPRFRRRAQAQAIRPSSTGLVSHGCDGTTRTVKP